MRKKLTYRDAGVDTKEGEKAVKLMKGHVQKTFNANVLNGLGGFGSLFKLDLTGIKEPVLVSGTDGVGTKLKIAFLMDRHDTVGQDCVAMCVNDILCQGAKPLFFLDYIATGKVQAEKMADIVKGIADGCLRAGCALVGGETAEMPGFYSDGEYDMAGFAVGVVDQSRIIDGSRIAAGDVLIGLPSSGLHSNGFSLVRKLFFDQMQLRVEDHIAELGMTLGEALLTPTKIYAEECEAVSDLPVKGIIHITGGGFFENIPRIIPEGLGVEIDLGSWSMPSIFNYIQKCGDIERDEMYATFNMGVGMIMIIDEKEAFKVISRLLDVGEKAAIIGRIAKGHGVTLCQR
jgi:phosphoribosylformylglycinamidine cyclo-ligase